MRLVLVVALGCGASHAPPPEHPPNYPSEREEREAAYDADGRLVVEHVQKIAHEGYRTWVAQHVAAGCPADARELFQYTDASDVDMWGTLLRVECQVVAEHVVAVRVQSAGPDRTFDTGDDVVTTRQHREGDSR